MKHNRLKKKTINRSTFRIYARFTGLGFQMGLSFLAGIYGGKFLDGKLDTKPLFLVVGAVLGMSLGFLSLFKVLGARKRLKKHE